MPISRQFFGATSVEVRRYISVRESPSLRNSRQLVAGAARLILDRHTSHVYHTHEGRACQQLRGSLWDGDCGKKGP